MTPKEKFQTAAAVTALYVILTVGGNALAHSLGEEVALSLNKRSDALITAHYDALIQNGELSADDAAKQHQSDLELIKLINHKVIAGPSNWGWLPVVADASLQFTTTEIKGGEHQPSFMDRYQVTIIIDDEAQKSSLNVDDIAIVTLKRTNNAEEAAEQAIDLLNAFYNNEHNEVNTTITYRRCGNYVQQDNGDIDFTYPEPPHARQENAPSPGGH